MILWKRFVWLHGLNFLRDYSESNKEIIQQGINLYYHEHRLEK